MSALSRSARAPGLLLGDGVVLPETVELGGNVIVHAGTVVGEDVVLQDGCVVGKPPALGPHTSSASGADLPPALLGAGATVGAGAVVLAGAEIGERAVVADQAHVRVVHHRLTLDPQRESVRALDQ